MRRRRAVTGGLLAALVLASVWWWWRRLSPEGGAASSAEAISVRDEEASLFIGVKTTLRYHESRLSTIERTWFSLAPESVWFFTDAESARHQRLTRGHLVNTNCSAGHHRKALSCKMAVEFDAFVESGRGWFCHFDDDNYVNVPRLRRLLRDYDPRREWYLGKPSIPRPLAVGGVRFWFATGGAGFCLSRGLASAMVAVAGGGKLMSVADAIRLPDDVTVGYIVEHLLGQRLTVVHEFHSHLEPMALLARDALRDQISFSYSPDNVLQVEGFDAAYDPTRFLSLHCVLFGGEVGVGVEYPCPYRSIGGAQSP